MKLLTVRRARSRLSEDSLPHYRQRHLFIGFFFIVILILVRLGFWQIIKGPELTQAAENQYQRVQQHIGQRGEILFSDKKPLVLNQQVYRFYTKPNLLSQSERTQVVEAVLATLASQMPDDPQGLQEKKLQLLSLVDSDTKKWAVLAQGLSEKDKLELEAKNLPNSGFESYQTRFYPEGSMSAHLTGFVGKDSNGDDLGYFGLEGGLNHELEPRSFSKKVLTDALGYSLSPQDRSYDLDGRTIITTLRRDIQVLLEQKLHQGMMKYGPQVGEVIVLDPATGNLLGLAAEPTFDQKNYAQTETATFSNPSLAMTYEPGSTFKVLTVAAGIDSGVITPDSICDRCAGPRQFGEYQIKTWNEEYHPNISMSEALAKSDNVAMIYVAEKVGSDRLRNYFKNFGIGDPIGIELQNDTSTPFPDHFRPVELATASFGQGISTNSLQLVRAVSAIANQGIMMKPKILSAIYDPITGNHLEIKPTEVRRVVSAQTAQQVTQMMIYSAQHGEAQWTYRPDHTVAGKTGTSQVASQGGYDEDQTIASFIGFAPAQKPAFVMLVKLTAPTSSIWAAETAAPLWYDIAEELYLLLQIPPDRQ